MDSDLRKAKESIFRKQYEQLMLEAEKENRRREDERRHELLSENPLDKNYARWSTDEEMKESLTPIIMGHKGYETSGIPLLCSGGITYVDSSDSHSLIIGASGSKKSRLFMMPSILTLCKAGESIVVTDPKAELYERTSGILKSEGYKVYCINFRDDVRQNSWNPLEIPRQFFSLGKFDLSVGLLNDFAHISVPKSSDRADPFWNDSARSAFMGMLLVLMMLAESKEEVNIRSLLRLRTTLFKFRQNHKIKNIDYLSKIMELIDDECLAGFYLSGVHIAPEKTFQSILLTLDTHLMKFVIRPEITDMLCHNDFEFCELGEKKVAIFVVMPDEKETYHGLVSVFIQQCYQALIFEAQKKDDKALGNRVNFLLDEFSSLPKIKEFPSMIAAARSRNIRFSIVVQSEKQLYSKYESDAETIEGNCNNWIYLYSKEIHTLEKISTLCGTQKSGKPLITVSRLQRLNKSEGEVLVFHDRQYPYISHLDDIDDYLIDSEMSSACEPSEIMPTRIFKLERIIASQSEEFLRSKLSGIAFQNSKEVGFSSQAWELLDQIGTTENDIIQSRFYDVATKSIMEEYCYANMKIRMMYDIFIRFNDGTQNLIKSKVPISSVVAIPEYVAQNLFFVTKDVDIARGIAHIIANRVMSSGFMIALQFDMQKMPCVWNDLLAKRKDGITLLSLLIANKLMIADSLGNHLSVEDKEIDDSLLSYTRDLINEFEITPNSKPNYLVILLNMDMAENISDAIWQAWKMGSYPNVQLIAMGSDEKIVEKNCLEYCSEEKKVSFASPMDLYFDGEKNEVMAKQEAAPSVLLKLS